MSSVGRQTVTQIGSSISVLANPNDVRYKPGGITIDWSTVAAQSGSDATFKDGRILVVGKKGLRYGQILVQITASAKYGPYDPLAADGRQTLTKGLVYILPRTVFEEDDMSDHPGVIDGGRVFKERLLITTGTHSLAAGPTVTEFETIFWPAVQYAV